MTSSKLYIIGKKGDGVIFLRTEPLRVAQVSHQTIVDYETSHPGVDGYARIAAAAKGMLASQDGQAETSLDQVQIQGVEALIAGGAVISEADFALVGTVVDTGWDTNRDIRLPIENPLMAVGPSGATTGDLFDAILSDTPNTTP
ncbi:hypothetical protein J2858_004459 [Neorhizobium galegae]|uniref:hypothetical protein n=1 Tax=Rhizobium/Agrobacterium group TaxID=227290 RepID=UPI001AE67CA3|nr:hypothetical protein [Neorhizobium galegae]MBP2551517.1 hypothetical protein [Neorhizobium galegae]